MSKSRDDVVALLQQSGYIPSERLSLEVSWFFECPKRLPL